jgi:hypothetical protein
MQTEGCWPTCDRCGSSLAGRYENTATRTITGVAYVIDMFRCGIHGSRKRT